MRAVFFSEGGHLKGGEGGFLSSVKGQFSSWSEMDNFHRDRFFSVELGLGTFKPFLTVSLKGVFAKN